MVAVALVLSGAGIRASGAQMTPLVTGSKDYVFSTGAGIYDPLFMAAGPQPDGSLKGERVAKNLAALAGDDPDAWLIQLMHEYVGFAMFQAESLMARDAERSLKDTVSEMLKPVRPLESSGPASSMMRGESALSFGPSPPSLRG